jgi:hypothetical protein
MLDSHDPGALVNGRAGRVPEGHGDGGGADPVRDEGGHARADGRQALRWPWWPRRRRRGRAGGEAGQQHGDKHGSGPAEMLDDVAHESLMWPQNGPRANHPERKYLVVGLSSFRGSMCGCRRRFAMFCAAFTRTGGILTEPGEATDNSGTRSNREP